MKYTTLNKKRRQRGRNRFRKISERIADKVIKRIEQMFYIDTGNTV